MYTKKELIAHLAKTTDYSRKFLATRTRKELEAKVLRMGVIDAHQMEL